MYKLEEEKKEIMELKEEMHDLLDQKDDEIANLTQSAQDMMRLNFATPLSGIRALVRPSRPAAEGSPAESAASQQTTPREAPLSGPSPRESLTAAGRLRDSVAATPRLAKSFWQFGKNEK